MNPSPRRHRLLQILRRCVQLGVVLLVLGVVFLSLYAHYDAARALDDVDQEQGWRWVVLKGIHAAMDRVEDPGAFLAGFKGTLWSMRLAGFDISDPLAALELLFSARSLHLPMLVSVLIPAAATLLLGKLFCSWLCPAYLLFELSGKLRRLLRLAEIRPASVEFTRWNKYALLAVGLLAGAALGLPFFSLVYPPAVLSRLSHAWVFGTAMTGGLVLMGVLMVFELLVSPRWWCRSMCPGGAVYGLLGWARPLRVVLDRPRCDGCRLCSPVCEMGLDPVRESAGLECDNCGRCLGACPQGALGWSLGLPANPLARAPGADRGAA